MKKYAVIYGNTSHPIQKGGFEDLKTARKYAYEVALKTHMTIAVFEVLPYGDLDMDGGATYENGTIVYTKPVSKKKWELKRDGTLKSLTFLGIKRRI